MKQITHHYDSLSYIPFFLGDALGMDPSDEQQGFHVMPNMTSCLLGGFNIIINPGSPGDENKLLGGFNPSEKYESQLFTLFPMYGKIKHVPNHHFVPLCVAHCLGVRRQCFNCGDSTVSVATRPRGRAAGQESGTAVGIE